MYSYRRCSRKLLFMGGLIISILSGCTTYQAKPLNDSITLPQDLTQLKGSDKQGISLSVDFFQLAKSFSRF